MYILIRYEVGVVVEGVVLAQRKDRLRVAVPGFSDILELKRAGAGWMAARQHVEIEFMMPNSCGAPAIAVEMPTLQVRAMGFAQAN